MTPDPAKLPQPPPPKSWRENIQQITHQKRGEVPWSPRQAADATYAAKTTGRLASQGFMDTFVHPGKSPPFLLPSHVTCTDPLHPTAFEEYQKMTKKLPFHMSPLRSHYRRSQYGGHFDGEEKEPTLRVNEASQPYNILHHHDSKHPDEPEPGGPGNAAQRSSIPYDIIHGGVLVKHEDWPGRPSPPPYMPQRAKRKRDIITHAFKTAEAKEEAIRAAQATQEARDWRESTRNRHHGPLMEGSGAQLRRAPTTKPHGKYCPGVGTTEARSEGYAYNILNTSQVVRPERLREFDTAANAGFRRFKKSIPIELMRARKHRHNDRIVEEQAHNRIAITSSNRNVEGMYDYNLITGRNRYEEKQPRKGYSTKSQPLWEKIQRYDEGNFNLVDRYGEFAGLHVNNLGKAPHNVLPRCQEKHKSMHIVPDRITRVDEIKARFGSDKPPGPYLKRGDGLPKNKSPRRGKSPRKGGGILAKSSALSRPNIKAHSPRGLGATV